MLALVVVAFSPAVLFVVQNRTRTSGLSLNLGFAAFELAQPLPVPVLMLISLGMGLMVGAAWSALRSFGGRRRVSRYEREPVTSGPTDTW